MPRPVARVRSARRAPGLKLRRANSPSGRKPITRRSKPHGNGRIRPRSRPTMPSGRALRARTHRPSGGVVYDYVATSAKPKRTYRTSLLSTALNLVRVAAWLEDTPRATPRRSRLCDTRGIGAYGGAPENSPSVSVLILLANPFQSSGRRVCMRCSRLLWVQRSRRRGKIYGSSEFANSIPSFVEKTCKCLCRKGSCLSAQTCLRSSRTAEDLRDYLPNPSVSLRKW